MEKETKHDKFKRVATKRVNEILEKIRILENCSNRASYEYSEDEVNKIFSQIEKQLKVAKIKFTSFSKEKFQL